MYLCVCNDIKDSAFLACIEQYPDMTFQEVCQEIGVAQECGGCIEYAYDYYRNELSKRETSE